MNVASLELSKELFSLCADMWPDAPVQVGYVWGKTSKDNKVTLVRTSDMAGLYTWWFAFDLGFLLRKLPRAIPFSDGEISLRLEIQWSGGWVAHYGMYDWKQAIADTPEDCAAKLCCILFQQGILTRKGEK